MYNNAAFRVRWLMTHSWKTSERSMPRVELPSAESVRRRLPRCFLNSWVSSNLGYGLGGGANLQEGLWWRPSQAIWTSRPLAPSCLFCQEPVWINIDLQSEKFHSNIFPGRRWCSSHLPTILLVWTHLAKMTRLWNLPNIQYWPYPLQELLKKELPKMKRKVEASKDEPDAKKIKVDPAEEKQKEEMKKQNKRFVWIWETLVRYASQDVLLPGPDEEAHEEEGAGGFAGAQ